MQAEASRWGARLIELEKQLDQLFAGNEADPATLEKMLAEISQVQSRIRYSHLNAHIEQRKILTRHQLALYRQHRGYGAEHLGRSQHHD